MSAKPKFKDHVAALSNIEKAISTKWPNEIFIYGSEQAIIDKTAQYLRNKWKAASGRDVCFVDATKTKLEDMGQYYEQGDLFGDASLQVMRGTDKNRQFAKALEIYPQPENPVIYLYYSEKLAAALEKQIQKRNMEKCPCVRPWPNELPQLIGMWASNYGLKLSGDALFYLIDVVGSDLLNIDNELRKLSYLFSTKDSSAKAIECEQILPHVGLLRADNAFALEELLMKQQTSRAVALLDQLLTRGESPLGILNLLARYCRICLQVEAAKEGGVPQGAMASSLRLPPFVIKKYYAHVQAARSLNWRTGISLCSEVDLKLKSSKIDPLVLLSNIISAI